MKYTRVFTEGGTVAHLLDYTRSPNSCADAICGRSPWPGMWHGTGSQDEEERAQDLTTCVRCDAVLKHRSGGQVFR